MPVAEITVFVGEAGSDLQQIEQVLNHLNGIERVLADTDDGEIKIAFDAEQISGKQIVGTLQKHDVNTI
ncbi:hypothetical protein [Lentibacillus sp.]|uniref:hypothetical protein n=1 Tax=Lentibacillus sp. TaxID=1925746 RepID=UPI002B4B6F84|nr:hypothetical protein [Lentibacillus sp.]HLS10269.1 hypothetical protein [Lentibacillus sp.]